ncbi:IS3 family transposase, partial [Candidatus Azambacteria bacterium]|nr:IS3 family transposase [Candidatus Azambacteria bacterium]
KSDQGQKNAMIPNLIKSLIINRPSQVWVSDFTYLWFLGRFIYLATVVDAFTREIVGWVTSTRHDTKLIIEALDQAQLKYETPEIIHSDQGSHFTSEQFLKPLQDKKVKISMNGRGRCLDNIFTERLWRTVKYENVYLKSYQNINEAKTGLTEYFLFYNHKRKHQSLNKQTPANMYFNFQRSKEKSKILTPSVQHKLSTITV